MYGRKATKSELISRVNGDITDARLIKGNTLQFRQSKATHILYHNTIILSVYDNGKVTIRTGGWNTITTRQRLNEYIPSGFRVWTEKGEIYLRAKGITTLFGETITIGARGKVTTDKTKKQAAKQKREIDAYLAEYKIHGLPTIGQSGGDPWIFNNAVTGDIMQDWVKSKYRHRLMFLLAHKHAGISDIGCSMYAYDIDRHDGKLDNFHIQRIRRYVKHCLAH